MAQTPGYLENVSWGNHGIIKDQHIIDMMCCALYHGDGDTSGDEDFYNKTNCHFILVAAHPDVDIKVDDDKVTSEALEQFRCRHWNIVQAWGNKSLEKRHEDLKAFQRRLRDIFFRWLTPVYSDRTHISDNVVDGIVICMMRHNHEKKLFKVHQHGYNEMDIHKKSRQKLSLPPDKIASALNVNKRAGSISFQKAKSDFTAKVVVGINGYLQVLSFLGEAGPAQSGGDNKDLYGHWHEQGINNGWAKQKYDTMKGAADEEDSRP
ncbi:MAG: hypothetical protein Q9167_003042 [Letrouitia subvulpina]